MFEFRKNIAEIFNKPKPIETFPDGRVLYSSGEIFDKQGNLWGYRVYKGVIESRWDHERNTYNDAVITTREQYEELLSQNLEKIRTEGNMVENIWGYKNDMTPFEQMAAYQAGMATHELACYSWSRDPEKALKFAVYKDRSANNIVLQVDVESRLCISQEKLRDTMLKTNTGDYPMTHRPDDEREITVFDHIDTNDDRVKVFSADEFEQNLHTIPFSSRFIHESAIERMLTKIRPLVRS